MKLSTLKELWTWIGLGSIVGTVGNLIASVVVLTRPHGGHRGPIHWEAATILLYAAFGCLVLLYLAHHTYEALDKRRN